MGGFGGETAKGGRLRLLFPDLGFTQNRQRGQRLDIGDRVWRDPVQRSGIARQRLRPSDLRGQGPGKIGRPCLGAAGL
jgi:hypothetical protein